MSKHTHGRQCQVKQSVQTTGRMIGPANSPSTAILRPPTPQRGPLKTVIGVSGIL